MTLPLCALTPKQRQVLDVIVAAIRATGVAPSILEIGRAVSLSSTQSVHRHLVALERKRFIRRGKPNHARALTLQFSPDAVCLACGQPVPVKAGAGAGKTVQS